MLRDRRRLGHGKIVNLFRNTLRNLLLNYYKIRYIAESFLKSFSNRLIEHGTLLLLRRLLLRLQFWVTWMVPFPRSVTLVAGHCNFAAIVRRFDLCARGKYCRFLTRKWRRQYRRRFLRRRWRWSLEALPHKVNIVEPLLRNRIEARHVRIANLI